MAKTSETLLRSTNDPTALGRAFVQRLTTSDLLLGAIASEYLRPSLVKIYKYAGYDFIYVENEHTMFNGRDLSDFITSARDNALPVIAKVAQLERAEVARLLDAGVVGVQLPRTESREDLLALIDYMKFPPVGTGAGAPCFGNVDYLCPSDHQNWLISANASTVVVAHIETARGYENAEKIISTPHLGMVYVGPYDFSIAMGRPGDYDHDAVCKPMLKILELCLKYNVPFGTTPSGYSAAADWTTRGCRFFETTDELTHLTHATAQEVISYRNSCSPR